MTPRPDPPRHPPAALFLTCPRCGKRAYATKAAAKAARREMGDRALHLYRCAQGNLHLGHMAPGATREVYRARAAAANDDIARMTEALNSPEYHRYAASHGHEYRDVVPAIAGVVLSTRARRDVDYYRAMAADSRTAAASCRAQAQAAQPTREPADLERDAQAADLDATRWDALADELDALEPAGGPAGQEPML